jgi:hypothetical protein
MVCYEKVKNKPRVFRSLTGLNPEEFDKLLISFTKSWEDFIQKNYLDKKRKRAFGGGRKSKLHSIEDKLFFILFYYKSYPLQEVIAFLFGISQGQANEWIHKLSKVLNNSLGYENQLPEREAKNLEEILNEHIELEFMIDGTERRIQRPKDNDKQKRYYSGKKKCHTVKNNVIINADNRKVIYLSKTYEGKKHDKKICDEEVYSFPINSLLWKDTGFQGYEPNNVITIQPKKKPRGKELSSIDKFLNKIISSVRVRIEHAIGGVKISRIVKDIYRNHKNNFEDLIMEISCGLHNFRVDCRFN